MSVKHKKRPLITVIGGQGYIGNIVCGDLLKQKYKVISIDNRIYDQRINLNCSHCICKICYSNLLLNNNYRCPSCRAPFVA